MPAQGTEGPVLSVGAAPRELGLGLVQEGILWPSFLLLDLEV